MFSPMKQVKSKVVMLMNLQNSQFSLPACDGQIQGFNKVKPPAR